MTNEDAGAAISQALDIAETNANDMVDAVSGLSEAWAQISTMDGVSTLETLAMKGDLEALVIKFRADIYAYHSKAFQRAVAVGIDDIFPQPRGGGR